MISGDRDASKTYYDVDIVAVHGLNGDAYSTWTHAQTEKLWLRDFLPSDLPGARIYSFGYPAEVAFNTATGKLDDWARALLEGLKAVRAGKEEKCSTRAIVFLCHSMGGLVVKQAIRGILFLATPHRGSDITTFPKILSNLANIALIGSSRFVGGMRTDLIQLLQANSPALTKISTDFRNQVSGIKIVSFKEQKLTPPFDKLVVDEHSSVIGLSGETIVPMLDCDHCSICRFTSPKAGSYLLVLGHIKALPLG
ncbi:hypothetical protein F5882DRAFT_312127 [Hyaloscypha sp. PMI_1271]|nr:hypothetical protein F5882DRAFT_312127 [Hyaloscypha sp. PMI_1271]